MTAAVAPVSALLLSVAFLVMGNGLQGTLLPVRANLETFGTVEIGALGSSYFVGFAIGCLYGAHAVRRAGHIRAFAAMVAIASCVVLVHAVAVNPALWWLLRVATGSCFAILYMIIESWLNEKSTNENRGVVFALYTIVNWTVITLGQLMLLLHEPADFPLFALSSILVSLSAVPIAFTKAQAPEPITAIKIRIRRLYRDSPVGVAGCFSAGLALGSFWALGPVFASADSGTPADVAIFMSVVAIGGATGQWPLGRLSDAVDRRTVIILASVGAALAGAAMIGLAEEWESGILFIAFVFGFFSFPLYALSVAHMNDFVKPQGYFEAAGGLLLVFAAGSAIGPLAASLAINRFGINSLFAWMACVHVAFTAFTVYRVFRRKPTPEEDQIAFTEALRIAQTVSTVDPLSPAPEDGS